MAVMIINIAINGFDVSGHVEHLVAEEVNGVLIVRFDLADDELRILMGRDRAPSIPDTRRPHGAKVWPMLPVNSVAVIYQMRSLVAFHHQKAT